MDYDAVPIRESARETTLALLAAGFSVLLIILIGGWWFMNRFVIQPVSALHASSMALTRGELDARVDIPGSDELSQLGTCFNEMASALQRSLIEVREKGQFLQGLMDAVPDGFRVIDEDYKVVLANHAYLQQLGKTPDQAVNVACYQSSHGRSQPCAPTLTTCPLYELEQGAEPVKCVHTHIHADGSEVSVELYAAALEVEQAGVNRRFVVESIRNLDEAVQFSHEQKLSEVGHLAAGVAHEIYNPLNSVQMLMGSLQRLQSHDDENHEEIQRCLDLVDHEIERCVDITGRLLKLSVNAGSVVQIVGVNEAIRETLSLLRWDAEVGGILIEENLDLVEPRILARESDFRMVVLNLIQNAFHAMPGGGVLRLSTKRHAGKVSISVEDSGVGIDPKHIQRIFDPFFSRRADGVHGTGLGLAISRTSVERDGGTIVAESSLGKGSVFTVTFPDPEEQARVV